TSDKEERGSSPLRTPTNPFSLLAQIFYNPKAGYIGPSKLIEVARKLNVPLSDASIRKWYNGQKVNQLWKQSKNKIKKLFVPIRAPEPGYLQADLIDMNKYHKTNDGYCWLLTVIDVYTREGFVVPLKSKTEKEVSSILINIFDSYPHPVKALTTDDGTEFKGPLTSYLEGKGIKLYIANLNDNTKTRTALVENFNRIILKKIFKSIHRGSTPFNPKGESPLPFRYIDVINDI